MLGKYAGRKDGTSYTFGMLDTKLPDCLAAYMPGLYTTRESGLTDLVRDVCARGQLNGQSTQDQADMLRELGEQQHARRALRYYGCMDMKLNGKEEQVPDQPTCI